MSNANWAPQEEAQLAEYLVTRVCDRASGRTDNECLRNYPRDVYFIGNLRPKPLAEDNNTGDRPEHLRELLSKLSPVAFGAEFRLKPDAEEMEVLVKASWVCYYRVFPTLTQQREHQQQQIAQGDSEATADDVAEERRAEMPDTAPLGLAAEAADAEEPTEAEEGTAAEEEREERQAEEASPE